MELGIISCFVILLISSTHVDARYKFEHTSMDEDPVCESCLLPQRKADPKLFEELSMLTSEVCHILPSDLKVQCLMTSEAYMHRTKLLMKGLFNKESLCNSTGLCLMKPMFQNMELMDTKTCTTCRNSVKDIFTELKLPKIRMKVMEALIEYCEEVEQDEQACKQTVYKYIPLILSKLEKLKANDLCRLIGFCDEGVTM